MRAWEDADFDCDLADVLQAATIDSHALIDDPLANPVLELLVEELAEDVDVLWESLSELGDGLLAQLVGSGFARCLVGTERCLVEPQCEVLAHDLDHLLREGRRCVLVFRFANLLLQLDLGGAQLLDRFVGHLERVDHRLLGDALGSSLDHQDGVGRAGDHEVEVRVGHPRRRRVDHQRAVEESHPHRPDWARPWDVGDRQGGGRPVDAEDCRVVLLVSRQHGRDDLDVQTETVGEQRPQRAVGQA